MSGVHAIRESIALALDVVEVPTPIVTDVCDLSLLEADSSLEQVEAALKQVALRTNAGGIAERAIERERAIGAVKRVKCVGGAVALVDAFLISGKAKPEKTAKSSADEPEPAAEAQDTATLLRELVDVFEHHVMLPEGAAIALALWTMHTWVLSASFYSPRIAVTSATKRCGKTLVLDLLNLFCRRSLMCAGITGAVLFRVVERDQPSLLIDEADTFLQNQEELRGVLNAGFKRDGRIMRCVGEDHEPKQFNCFAPTAIAAIGSLPGTILDRAIVIRMERKEKKQNLARLDRRAREHLKEDLPSRLARWAADHESLLQDAAPILPESLNDRQRDISEPLFAIADLGGAGWGQLAREAICRLLGREDTDSEDLNERLLRAVWGIFEEGTEDFLSLKQLVEALNNDETGGWDSVMKGRPCNTAWVSKHLKAFGLTVRQRRPARVRGFPKEDLVPVVARYLSVSSTENWRDGVTEPVPCGPEADLERVTAHTVSRASERQNPASGLGRHAVTHESRPNEDDPYDAEERAAIMEFNGGVSHGEAERIAFAHTARKA